MQTINSEIDKLKTAAEKAQREGELNRAAEITYGRIPELGRSLEHLQHGDFYLAHR